MYEYGLKNLPGLIFLVTAYYNYIVLSDMAHHRGYRLQFSKLFMAKKVICQVLMIINLVYVGSSIVLYLGEDRLIDPGSKAVNACIVS